VRSIRPKECAFVADRPSSVECSGLLGSCGVTQVAAATRARPPSAPHKQSGRRARPIRTRIHKRINVRFFLRLLFLSSLARTRSSPPVRPFPPPRPSSRDGPPRAFYFSERFYCVFSESEQPRHSSAAARASSLTSPCRPERHRVFRRYKRRSKISCVKIPRRRDTFPVKIMQPR
jgi:hypothetical protein